MADDPIDAADERPESDAFEEWIQRVAAAEDIAPDAAVERLVSSYWMLQEIQGMLGDTGLSHATDDVDGQRAASSDIAGDAQQSNHEAAIASVTERLDDLEAQVDELTETSSTTPETSPSHREVQGQLTMLAERIDAVTEVLESRQASLESQHESLESRLDAELSHLVSILEYLLDTTEEVTRESRTRATERRELADLLEEQRRVVDLKRNATRAGVRSATCDHCATTVDVAVLPTADCPACDRRFVDVEPASGWFGRGSGTLLVDE